MYIESIGSFTFSMRVYKQNLGTEKTVCLIRYMVGSISIVIVLSGVKSVRNLGDPEVENDMLAVVKWDGMLSDVKDSFI